MTKKRKITKKQKETLEKMKLNRQIDSNNLRELIKGKLDWAKKEKAKGESTINQVKIQIARLDGIILFINDLLQSSEE